MTINAIIPMISFNTSTPAIYVLTLLSKEMWDTFSKPETLLTGRTPKSYGQKSYPKIMKDHFIESLRHFSASGF